ncbi:hypothetical protein [Halosimplex pelagicum]|uniref:Uncharacterized protein n=1 Tax=Halosimplex pelagicum TaxID=869886 RepID=A0A7D5TC87_9EURY|nr:hypothetical protein [Halosimplex pelagicum]QLH82853.1 hypothetical protein HZS54_15015 [Halosimplex pelagicum]
MESETGIAWLPDRTPTWTDVLVGALAGVLFLSDLTTVAGLQWTWVAGGFVGTALVLGPVARSSLGARASEWSRAGGALGGIALIAAFVALAWVVREVVGVPQAVLSGLASGVFLAVTVFVALHVACRRTVEGW